MTCRRTLCKTFMLMLTAVTMCMIGAGVGAADELSVTLEGQFGGATIATAPFGNYVYIGQGSHFVVLDITDKSTPIEIDRLDTSGTIEDIALAGNYAYVADGSNGLVIVDVSNPEAPTIKGSYDIFDFS